MSDKLKYKAGFVGVLGCPNAGKSSLVNSLIGEKVGIISSKPQTTRNRCLGILTGDNYQMVFIDSPGYIEADTGLNQFLAEEFESVIKDSDILMVVLNIDEKSIDQLLHILQLVTKQSKPWFIVISKVDLPQVQRIDILKQYIKEYDVPLFEFSVNNNKNLENRKADIIEQAVTMLPVAKAPLYDSELYTDQSLRAIASEIVREKVFHYLHQEIPYNLAVQVLKYDEQERIDKIYMNLLVNKKNHKPMVIGSKGSTLKQIGRSSREELEKIIGKKVYLELHVKHQPWLSNQKDMKELGYVHS